MRTTIKRLESLVTIINKITKSPLTPWTKTDRGIKANIGNYHLYECLGCINLHRMCNEGGGVSSVFYASTKRELEIQLQAFISGYTLKDIENEVPGLKVAI